MIIFWNNLKRIFGRPLNLVFMLLIPILSNVFVISTETAESKYEIGILDRDKTTFTEDVKKNLAEISSIHIVGQDENMKQKILDGEIDIGIEFEKGYTDGLIHGQQVNAKTYALNSTNQTESGEIFLESLLETARQIGLSSKGVESSFYEGMNAYYEGNYKVEYEKFQTSIDEKVEMAILSLGYVAFGIAFLMMYATTLVLEDKVSGVYERICVTPLNLLNYYIQNLLSFFTVAVVQIVALFAILSKTVGLSYGQTLKDVVQTAAVCFCFSLVCISVGLLISRFSKTTFMASAFVAVVNVPALMLGGCLWPKEIMPQFMQKIGEFVPTTWFLKAAEKVMYGRGILSAWNYAGGMLVFSFVMLAIAFLVKTDKTR